MVLESFSNLNDSMILFWFLLQEQFGIANCMLYFSCCDNLEILRSVSGAIAPVLPIWGICCFLFCFRGNSGSFGAPPDGPHQVRLHLAEDMLAVGGMCARPLDGSSGPWFCAGSTWVRTLLSPWSAAKAGIVTNTCRIGLWKVLCLCRWFFTLPFPKRLKG